MVWFLLSFRTKEQTLDLEHILGEKVCVVGCIVHTHTHTCMHAHTHTHTRTQHVHETILGLRFRISPDAFFQTNTPATEVLYRQVHDLCCHSNHSDGVASVKTQPTVYGTKQRTSPPLSFYFSLDLILSLPLSLHFFSSLPSPPPPSLQ